MMTYLKPSGYLWVLYIFHRCHPSQTNVSHRPWNREYRPPQSMALFQQQILNHKISKPNLTPAFRQLWVIISRLYPHWKSFLLIVKPETVICWHHTAFRFYWARKSKQHGRPAISQATIALIKRIHRKNLLWSPERIYDHLVHLGITDAPASNTIAKYLSSIRKPPS